MQIDAKMRAEARLRFDCIFEGVFDGALNGVPVFDEVVSVVPS
jgi:hypothetical protein